MDELIKKVSALGVPGLIFVMVVAFSGFKGAAAITFALAALGGPFGMIGGLAFLGIVGLITHTIAEKGTEAVLTAVVKEQLKTKSAEEIIEEINKLPITKGLKLKIIDKIKRIALVNSSDD